MGFELNEQQKDATNKSVDWWKKGVKQTFQVSGPAGSGKTTIAYYLINSIGLTRKEVLFMAYVGKATMALALKGNFAQTIHSSIYDLVEVPMIDENGIILKKNGRVMTKTIFEKKKSLPDHIKLIVIDEGSMVNKNIAEDVLSFGLPVMVLGDLNQLPPVFGEPYFLLNPDVILTQIMRQAEGDPIIMLSQMALQGKNISVGKYGPRCFVIDNKDISDNMLVKSDIVICGKNKTRENINKYVRHNIQKIDKAYPVIGEKLICRQNNWHLSLDDNYYLINGLIGFVKDVHLESYNKKSLLIDFRPEFLTDDYFERLPIDYEFLFQPIGTKNNRRSYYNKFEFAYAITAHLAQGSQYEKVFVYDEKIGDKQYYRKWLYTAITRSSKYLILAV